jgi:hypothetical protein
MPRRSIAWVKPDPLGAEFADVEIARGRLTAVGIAIGSSPLGYRLDYKLETLGGYITTGLLVTARGQGWRRNLDLRRLRSGRWTSRTTTGGTVDLPPAGGDMSLFSDALDCDLAWSPLTNSMPVLRHDLLEGGGQIDFLMAWVSVPDLRVLPSQQRYRFLRKSGDVSIIRYESSSRDFVAELSFDKFGVCVSYPGIGHAL